MSPPHEVPGIPYPELGASEPAARPWGAQGGSFLQLRLELATLGVPGTQKELSPAKHSLCHLLSAPTPAPVDTKMYVVCTLRRLCFVGTKNKEIVTAGQDMSIWELEKEWRGKGKESQRGGLGCYQRI